MNALKTGVLMALLFGLFMLIGQVLGGRSGLFLGFGLALAMNFGAYWFSDSIALRMSGARELDRRQGAWLHEMVERVAERGSMPVPRVYVIPTPQPNAFATGRDPHHAAVAVTDGIVQALTPDELEAVIAHEMAHIRHRDTLIATMAATLAGAISMVAQMAYFFGGARGDDEEGGANPLVMLLMLIVAPLAAMLIQLAISRSREYEADRGGADLSGNPLALASALRKIEAIAERAPMNVNPASAHLYIVNPLGGDVLRSAAALFRTHPLTDDRVARLQAYARATGAGVRRFA